MPEAVDIVMHGNTVTALTTAPLEATGTELAVAGYIGFNVVRHRDHWYGFDQATGPIDIGRLAESALDDMKRKGTCVTGRNSADLKAQILRRVIQTREQRDSGLATRLEAAETAIRNHRDARAGLP